MATYSVVISTHRRPDWLRRAMLSVLAQSHPSVAMIVVSDAACEATYTGVTPLMRPGDLFVQRGGDPGPAASRNLGMRLLGSDHALFLDDDDELSPDFLRDVDALRPKDHRGIVYTDFSVVTHQAAARSASVAKHTLRETAVETVFVKNFIPNSCLVYPAKLLKSRGFDVTLRLNEDWDFILNAMSGGALLHLPVEGPVIHKTEAPRRGNSNHELLLDTYVAIYRKWPAPNKALKAARQALLAGVGIEVPLSEL